MRARDEVRSYSVLVFRVVNEAKPNNITRKNSSSTKHNTKKTTPDTSTQRSLCWVSRGRHAPQLEPLTEKRGNGATIVRHSAHFGRAHPVRGRAKGPPQLCELPFALRHWCKLSIDDLQRRQTHTNIRVRGQGRSNAI